jgi:predicted O-linked N-acetylglucosamine transferase (SPINDLY family)
MRLPGTGSWRIVALHMATLAALVFGILSLRGNRAQPKEDRDERYRSITARLLDECQLPQGKKRITLGGILELLPGPSADDGAATMVLNGQTGAAIQKLRVKAKGPEALTSLAAALLTHSDEISLTLEALVAARKAIAQSPSLAAAHFNLALALERLGFTPEARVEFENAATRGSSTCAT